MPGSGEGSVENKLSKVLDRLKEIERVNKELNRNMQVMHEDYLEVIKRLEESDKEVKSLKKSVSFLEAENYSIKAEVRDLRAALEESHYFARSNEMDIVGLSPTPVDDLRGSFKAICKKIDVKFEDKDIRGISRVSGKKGPTNAVRVVFSDRTMCANFVEKGRKAKIKGEEIGLVGSKDYIYFNEFLTPFARKLMYNARLFKKENGFRYLWSRGGKIFLRKADKEPAIRIACLADLEVLKEK